jgi:hypothetical protein
VPVAAANDLLWAETTTRQLALPLLVSGATLAVAEVAELSEGAGRAGDAPTHIACPAGRSPAPARAPAPPQSRVAPSATAASSGIATAATTSACAAPGSRLAPAAGMATAASTSARAAP